jgi:DNA-damage-inducible protein J
MSNFLNISEGLVLPMVDAFRTLVDCPPPAIRGCSSRFRRLRMREDSGQSLNGLSHLAASKRSAGTNGTMAAIGHLGLRKGPRSLRRSEAGVRYNVSREDDLVATTMVHVRIDRRVKDKATKALAAMGLSVSDAVRVLLVRVAAEKALPFDVKVPNATTVKALEAADRGEGKRYSSPEALLKDLGI